MMAIDLENLNGVLLSALRIVVATRRLFKDLGLELPNLQFMERSLRTSVAEVQAAIKVCRDKGELAVLNF